MNNNHISVKSRNPSFMAKGIIWLLITVASLLIALLPLLTEFDSESAVTFGVIGGVAFVVSGAMFIRLLVLEIKPKNELVMDSRGFREYKHLAGAEVEWTNVASVGIFGTKKSPMLGIVFENNDIVIDSLRNKAAAELRDNLEENLPSLLITQNEVKMPLAELRSLFERFVREARTLEGSTAPKHKSNPFSTEDVLRAFGKLPADGSESKSSEPAGKRGISASEFDPDSFYEQLKQKSSFAAQTAESVHKDERLQIEPEDLSVPKKGVDGFKNASDPDESGKSVSESNADDDFDAAIEKIDMPDEIRDLLSKSRSAKIVEIEKLLNEKNTPYSANRIASPPKEEPERDPVEPEAEKDNPEPVPAKNGPEESVETKPNVPKYLQADTIVFENSDQIKLFDDGTNSHSTAVPDPVQDKEKIDLRKTTKFDIYEDILAIAENSKGDETSDSEDSDYPDVVIIK